MDCRRRRWSDATLYAETTYNVTDMPDDLLSSLTPAQREAVGHVAGPLLILAGPGSGKTRVVTHRIAHLLEQGIAARNVIALTFTNKAADEMQARLTALVPGEKVWMGTFHRFCARLLRQYAAITRSMMLKTACGCSSA
jgi:DNA helicase-2/ATP-dependent DNA helicase PcrA